MKLCNVVFLKISYYTIGILKFSVQLWLAWLSQKVGCCCFLFHLLLNKKSTICCFCSTCEMSTSWLLQLWITLKFCFLNNWKFTSTVILPLFLSTKSVTKSLSGGQHRVAVLSGRTAPITGEKEQGARIAHHSTQRKIWHTI